MSNTADATVQVVEVAADGRLSSKRRIGVGDGPKRVGFLPKATAGPVAR